jgi:hypothetical protein
MHTINIPIKNTWSHLLSDCDNRKRNRINEIIKQICANLYIDVMNDFIKKYGYINTQNLRFKMFRKDNHIIIKLAKFKAVLNVRTTK